MSLLTIALIAALWLTLLAVVLWLCRMAKRADRAQHATTPTDSPPGSGSSSNAHSPR